MHGAQNNDAGRAQQALLLEDATNTWHKELEATGYSSYASCHAAARYDVFGSGEKRMVSCAVAGAWGSNSINHDIRASFRWSLPLV